jgi:hypothetical protein
VVGKFVISILVFSASIFIKLQYRPDYIIYGIEIKTIKEFLIIY